MHALHCLQCGQVKGNGIMGVERTNSDSKKSVTPGSSGSITTFAINPTIGYKIADWLPALCPASQPKTTGAV